MERSTEWPWSWEEEAEWKADLDERDNEFLEGLMDSAVGDATTGVNYVPGPPREKPAEDSTPERYSVTA